jgi:hypothetical protein
VWWTSAVTVLRMSEAISFLIGEDGDVLGHGGLSALL